MFLNQILDEYRDTRDQGIIDDFLNRLWKSKYTNKKYNRYYTYKVNEEILSNKNELIDLFKQYSNMKYTVNKSFYNNIKDGIDYIRIHINNMYSRMVDKDVYYKKEYYKQLRTPKEEYLKAVKRIKKDESIDCNAIAIRIQSAINTAEDIKQISISEKLNLSWKAYKKLINTFIERIFNNYTPIHEYEEKHGWELKITVDGWSEDNYIISYFCRSLTGYFRNYVRDGKPKQNNNKKCILCGIDIVVSCNRKKYCSDCWVKRKKELRTEINKRHYDKKKLR